MPDANAPAASCAEVKSTRVSHHRLHRPTPAFPAQWLYGLLRALPGDRAFLSPSPRNAKALSQVDISVEMPVALFPKFVRSTRPHFHELRKAKGNCNDLIPVPLAILKFLKGFAANSGGTSKSAALGPHGLAVRSTLRTPCEEQAATAACPAFVAIASRPSWLGTG
jgi:hypothetical protein